MTFSTPIHTNEQSFERVLATNIPLVLVWTRKNDQYSAALDKPLSLLAITFEGKALIAKINAEENPKLTTDYKITSTPTLVFVREGKEVGRAVGAFSNEQLKPTLEALVQGKPIPSLAGGQAAEYAPKAAGSGTPLKVTDATFEQVINSDKPVLVDFWAAWCGPCRAIAPSIDTLAKEFAETAVVAKLNVDENPRTAQRFGIQGIPALLVFKNGKVVDQVVGAQPLGVLRQTLARHV